MPLHFAALDPASLRVLGSLMEKEMTTPDLYPLSLNALLAAANQRSSRDPVTDLSEDDVRGALHRLETATLVVPARETGRVARFEHRIRTVLNLRRDETAVLCLLLLRGPQTVGELRSRAERLFAFDDLEQAQATLDRLAARDEPAVQALARAPGSREVRYVHLLGDPPGGVVLSPAATERAAAREPRTDSLLHEVSSLRGQLEHLAASQRLLEARLEALEHAQAEVSPRHTPS